MSRLAVVWGMKSDICCVLCVVYLQVVSFNQSLTFTYLYYNIYIVICNHRNYQIYQICKSSFKILHSRLYKLHQLLLLYIKHTIEQDYQPDYTYKINQILGSLAQKSSTSKLQGKVSSKSVDLYLVICLTTHLTQSHPYPHLLSVRDGYPSLCFPSSLGGDFIGVSPCIVILTDVAHLAAVVALRSFSCCLLGCHAVLEEISEHLAIEVGLAQSLVSW